MSRVVRERGDKASSTGDFVQCEASTPSATLLRTLVFRLFLPRAVDVTHFRQCVRSCSAYAHFPSLWFCHRSGRIESAAVQVLN